VRYWLIVPAAGVGRRFGGQRPKQHEFMGARTVLHWALTPFMNDPQCRGLAIALAANDAHWGELAPKLRFASIVIAAGGAERSHSVANALQVLAQVARDDDWVLVHDAARPCVSCAEIAALLAAAETSPDGALLAFPVADTVKQGTEAASVETTADRTRLWRALTPQMFRYGALQRALAAAHAEGRKPSDEAQAIEWRGGQPRLVTGSSANIKITAAEDLALAAAFLHSSGMRDPHPQKIGFGVDVHAFGPGDHVMLGGVRVPYERGVRAHSDGDVVLHALCDAMLGCAALGDIGQHFPDSDPRWRGAPSREFVAQVVTLLAERGLVARHVDITVLGEAPRIAAYRVEMQQSIASLLDLQLTDVNIKATTTEKLGFLGRGEGLMAEAVVLATQRAPSS
jgi:2-C-methyl-D-erythritol 4-phosphate cytidylyltransferase/2-C-methyl-D-erythritol 2,4-cyclodiphosphate synthase